MSSPCQYACSPWILAVELECQLGTADQREEAVAVATDLLFEYSGRQYAGSCAFEVTVQREPWQTSICSPWETKLGVYPVTSIEEVTEDGELLDPSLYRVDNFRFLVRLNEDGRRKRWNLLGTGLEVSGTYGIFPSYDGIRACHDLACELLKGWTGSDEDCQISEKVTSLSRQGVSMDMLVLRPNEVREGLIGIKSVDRFLNARNPGGIRHRAKVGNPDLRQTYRRGT